jgi:hypothetical protein
LKLKALSIRLKDLHVVSWRIKDDVRLLLVKRERAMREEER